MLFNFLADYYDNLVFLASEVQIDCIKHPPSIMIWAAMSSVGTAVHYFLDSETNMNGAEQLNLFKKYAACSHLGAKCCIFMLDGALCHRSKQIKNYLQVKYWCPGVAREQFWFNFHTKFTACDQNQSHRSTSYPNWVSKSSYKTVWT